MFTVLIAYLVFFFLLVSWLAICVEVDVDSVGDPPTARLHIRELE